MIDLNKIVNDSMVQIENEGFVEKVVKEKLEKTIKDIVDDTFRSYSDFGKNLEKHIQEKLNINLKNLNIDGYNTLVLAAVQEKLDLAFKIQGIEKIKSAMDEMLKDVMEEYKLSELIEELKREDYRDEDEYNYDDQITLGIEVDGSFKYIWMDKEANKSKYDCEYRISFYKDEISHITIKDEKITKNNIMAGFYGLGDTLFKIYASGAKIVLDQGDDAEYYELNYREDY